MERATGKAALTRRGMAWQLFAYLGGMTAYVIHLLVGTALVPFACDIGTTLPLSALNLGVVTVAAVAGITAWRLWHAGRDEVARTGTTAARRSAFLGMAGFLLDVLAIAIVLFAEVHVWVLDPCIPG